VWYKMTKEEFIKASKNFAKYNCGIKLPIDEKSLIEREDCNYFFFYEFPSEYVDNDDNDVECTYWYSFSNFKDQRPEDGIEFATGIDGRSGDHFFISSKDWQEEK